MVPRLFLFAFASSTLLGQTSGAGSVNGRVLDPSGAVVTAAVVSITNTETGSSRSAVTNDSGLFVFANLPVGFYEMKVDASGFASFEVRRFAVNVGQAVELTIPLKVASEASSITVMEEVSPINMSQSVGTVISQKSIDTLPLNGRRFEDLALLTPGVVPIGGTVSFGGLQASGMTNFNIDGFDFNSSMFGRGRGGNRPPFQMSQEAIQEFQVVHNVYSAEFGRVGGGIINAVTKSGTNEFHGSGFWFIRDATLNARNSFAATKPDDRRQQFGGTFGGPIKRDKLFFFVSSDNQRQTAPVILLPGSALSNVAGIGQADVTAALNRYLAGNDPAFDRSLTPAQAWLNFIEVRDFVTRNVGLFPRRFDQINVLPRVDYDINDKLKLNLRYNYQRFDAPKGLQSGATGLRALENGGNTLVRTHSLGGQLSWIISPRTVNETRVQYARDNQPDVSPVGEKSELRGIPSEIRITDGQAYTFGPLNFLPRIILEDRYQVINTTTHLRGKHNIKFGFDINVVDQKNVQTRTSRGQYSFTNLVNFAIGAYRSFVQNLGDPRAPQTATDWAGFVQDEHRISPSLALNYGVRYDLQTFTQPLTVNPLVPETSRIPVDKNNFAPRLGFAWSPGRNLETVVRGGYGISYVRTLTVDTEIFLFRNGVARQLVNFQGPDNPGGSQPRAPVFPGVLDNRLTVEDLGIPVNTVEVGIAAPNRVQGYVQQANLTIERQWTGALQTSIGYLWLRGVKLTGKITENVGSTPVSFRDVAIVDLANRQTGLVTRVPNYDAVRNRPNPAVGDIFTNRSEFNSYYNAFFFQLNKRFSSNYLAGVSYTFSKSIDDNPQQQGADNSAPFGLRGENRGLSDQDLRHRVVAYGTVNLPGFSRSPGAIRALFGGWSLSAIAAYQTGFPYSARTATALTQIRAGNQYAPSNPNGPYVPFGRNTFTGFDMLQNDLRLSRLVAVREQMSLEFIGEAFNLMNRVNLRGPNQTFYNYSSRASFTNTMGSLVSAERLQPNPSFGQPSGASAAREFQFAIRFRF